MSTRLTPAGLALKWVAAPILVGLFGYAIVGPRLGKNVLDKVPLPLSSAAPAPPAEAPASPPDKGGSSSPTVTVGVHKAATDDVSAAEEAPKPKRRHHPRKVKPSVLVDDPNSIEPIDPKTPDAPPTKPDEGGSTGTGAPGQA